ncbi:MAG TPA: ABC transporter ATP-binding protein [Candidatus Dormibacteraeota bacterium]
MAGGAVELVGLAKEYGADVVAVADIDLAVAGGEFFSLLGPSGCGKTTTLRMIAGFVQPTRGRILIDGVDVAQTPPHKRPVNTVFQSYALFPFMTVYDNVAFGLRYTRATKAEVDKRVKELLALVRLTQHQKRRPAQLSGGQQQRVALARALVLNPKVLLLDEPLGALDAKLRKTLQIELKTLQEQLGITFVYVTHDQEEALTMSDRLAVMAEGLIEQVGTPAEVYEEPATAHVADFLGAANLMDGEVVAGGGNGACTVRLGDFDFAATRLDPDAKGTVKVVIRPERVRLAPHGSPGANRLPGLVERVVYLGSTMQLVVRLVHGPSIQAMVPNAGDDLPYEQGAAVTVELPAQALRVLPDRAATVAAPAAEPAPATGN